MFRLCVLLLPPQDNDAPLHLAAFQGKEAVAELLLRHKADVNSVDAVSADGCAGGGGRGVGWGRDVVFYFRVLVNVHVCVSSLACVCWGGGARLLRFV